MTAAAQPAAPTLEDHATYLAQSVYSPEFFKKLAAAPNNIVPNNEAEAAQLLQLAVGLRQRNWQPAKTAAAQAANPFLTHVLHELNQPQPATPALLKQASAAALQADPQLLASVKAIYDASKAA